MELGPWAAPDRRAREMGGMVALKIGGEGNKNRVIFIKIDRFPFFFTMFTTFYTLMNFVGCVTSNFLIPL
jgi:hypothetical protein